MSAMIDPRAGISMAVIGHVDPTAMNELRRALHERSMQVSVIMSAPPDRLWGFFHTTCIYESAAALVSLHRTKAGAWRAMHRAQWQAWEDARVGPRDPAFKVYEHERSHIAAVEVLP